MYATVNGTRLYFDVEGPGVVPDGTGMRERPAVLLLHGGPGFDHTLFKPYLSGLAGDAQLIYLDQRGQGRSERPPLETCTMEQMADDAAAFCQALGIARPVVLGHSFGGFVALQLALRHPDAIGRLILVDSAASSADMAGSMDVLERRHGPAARAAAEQLFGGKLTEETMEAFGRLVMPAYIHDPAKFGLYAEGAARTIMNTELMAHYFGGGHGSYDVRSRLGIIGVPTLVLVGATDWLLPPAASQVLAQGIPGAELVVVSDAGHLPFLEQTDRFNAAIRRFLAAPERMPAGAL